jgi:amino-acid N-acetyltransferase
MITEVRLQEATKEDIPLIVGLLRSNGLPYEDIASKICYLFIGYVGPRIIGIGGIEIHGKYGLLRSLVIEESLRGKGYGFALCDKLIEQGRLKGISEIHLLTTTAEDFFKKTGFERIERKVAPAVIQNTTEFKNLCPSSAVCMRMKIRDS